jgi:hypothetical protein
VPPAAHPTSKALQSKRIFTFYYTHPNSKSSPRLKPCHSPPQQATAVCLTASLPADAVHAVHALQMLRVSLLLETAPHCLLLLCMLCVAGAACVAAV